MSCLLVRASPQMTGPSTSRAIACTDSKSPGEVIGKPASITSTPSRASWWAISSFSCLFSEMPGDCSPSRSVVSKIMTRSRVVACCRWSLMPFVLLLYLAWCSSLLGMRLRGRHALFPPRGEQEKREKRDLQRHLERKVSTAQAPAGRWRSRDGHRPVQRARRAPQGMSTTLPTLRRSVIMFCAAPASSKLNASRRPV